MTSTETQRAKNKAPQVQLRDFKILVDPFCELWNGIRNQTLPWKPCTLWAVGTFFLLYFRLDLFICLKLPLRNLYPFHPFLYRIYAVGFTTAGFALWSLNEVRKKRERLKQLTDAFKNAGLKSTIGRLPNLVGDFAIDPQTRKLILTNAGFPVKDFEEKKSYLESELGIFIDEIKDSREKRTVEIIYAHNPMPTEIPYSSISAFRSEEVIIGKTRSKLIRASLKDTPHFLVAGLTGGGKSTFLRQLITHLYLQNKIAKFLLIDLKGGLEFFLFEDRSRIQVVPNVHQAVQALGKMATLLENRIEIFKKAKCKDIESYLALPPDKKTKEKKSIERQFIVIDEAAEMFLAGFHAKAKEIQIAREAVSQIARKGRAVGIHLVIATQRPDSKALDPQTKSCLEGVICFRMVNDPSSISVLGCGRATDLPKVGGRGIWKSGMDLYEIQTPFLSVEDAEKLLGPQNSTDEHQTIEEPSSGSENTQVSSDDPAESREGVETD